MAPPSSTMVSPVVSLIVRLLTCICLLISIVLLATNTIDVFSTDYSFEGKLKFSHFYAYRYHLAAAVVGLAYSLLQATLTVLLVSTGNRIGGDNMLNFDFYGDKLISYLLATATGASFGLIVDLKRLSTDSGLDSFIHKGEAAASLCLLGFLFSAISSIFSSFSLPKRV